MAEPKTKATKASVTDFLNSITPDQKRQDALVLLKMFKDITKEKPVMWGSAIVGFGMYHYKSEKSSQEGDWFLVGFSPRKQNLTLYILTWKSDDKDTKELLKKLGKHKLGGGCLYINRLSDVDLKILDKLIKSSFLRKKKAHK